MPRPDISVVIPARNERGRIAPTIQAIARARTTDARVEFVVVDDASTDETTTSVVAAVPELLNEPRIDIRVHRSPDHLGIYQARNLGADAARGEILFATDAHVRFSVGWDETVLRHLEPNRVLAGITTQRGSPFKGYGCDLVVPFMGTRWHSEPVQEIGPVAVAPCHATITTREMFNRLGGYDTGMLVYGAGEPEFSVRAWLHGGEVAVVEGLEVEHEFRAKDELARFVDSVRPVWVHNCLRFGLLYLSELGCLQLLRYYAQAFPAVFREAVRRVERSDVWERRRQLERQRQRSFEWFVEYFGLRNQVGGEII